MKKLVNYLMSYFSKYEFNFKLRRNFLYSLKDVFWEKSFYEFVNKWFI